MVTRPRDDRRGLAPTAGADGYTLVELLLASMIGLVLMGGALTVTHQVTRASNVLLDGSATQEEVQYAIEWMAEAIRPAGANPYAITTGVCPTAGTVFVPIAIDPNGTGLADNIRIKADTNPPNGVLGGVSGACTESGEDVTIAHDRVNFCITRRDNNVDAAAVPMTDRVISALTFRYLDSARAVTAIAANVAYVQISVTGRTVTRDQILAAATAYTLTSEVRVRLR
ncbi:MAG: hypothetical protein WCP29_07060 [Acidobacteriota bacterium]